MILNAANEEAVQAYCDGRIRFTGIYQLVDRTMQRLDPEQSSGLEDVLRIDRTAREVAQALLGDRELPFAKQVASL